MKASFGIWLWTDNIASVLYLVFHEMYPDDCCISLTDSCPSGEVRFIGTNSNSGGRVEICVEQSWTTVCDLYWDNEDASVLCRQFGFSLYGGLCVYILNTFIRDLF